jgi:hypothetical protein
MYKESYSEDNALMHVDLDKLTAKKRQSAVLTSPFRGVLEETPICYPRKILEFLLDFELNTYGQFHFYR